jgi:hypothetical protein
MTKEVHDAIKNTHNLIHNPPTLNECRKELEEYLWEDDHFIKWLDLLDTSPNGLQLYACCTNDDGENLNLIAWFFKRDDGSVVMSF